MELVEDPDDPRLEAFRRRDRQLDGLFLAESELVVQRAVDAGCHPVVALVDPAQTPPVAGTLGVPVLGAGEAVRRHVTGLGVVQPILALFERPAPHTLDAVIAGARRIVVLEAVDNPANVGAVVRSAAGLGWDGLVLDRTSADPLGRRALRVGMGAAFTLPHARAGDIGEILAHLGGFTTVALTPAADAAELAAVVLDGPTALLVGAERTGLSASALGGCDVRARIPMHAGVDSLNVAAAAAVACYALGPSGSAPR